MDESDRYYGCLLGLALGDALGTTLEFQTIGSFEPMTDMIGGGPFNLRPGEWTDDTSMALCLAESLIMCKDFQPTDQLTRYCRWFRAGHLSSTGDCFDIGITVRQALERYELSKQPYCGSTDSKRAGNGSLMRLAPVPMFYGQRPVQAIEKSGESSLTTHASHETVDACRYFGGLIYGALNGIDKETLLSPCYAPAFNYWHFHKLVPAIKTVANGSFKQRQPATDHQSVFPDSIRGTGYVVQSLEAALWAFYHSNSFTEGALKAVNLGEDADTTGAIYGQLAGAFYGKSGLPVAWLDRLAQSKLIQNYARLLLELSRSATNLRQQAEPINWPRFYREHTL